MFLIEDLSALVKARGDPGLCLEFINLLSPLLQHEEKAIKVFSSEGILKLIKESFKAGNMPDNQLVRETFEMLSPLFKDEDKQLRKHGTMLMVKLIRFSDKSDPQLVKDAFELITSLLNDPSKRVVEVAIDHISEFVQKVDVQYYRSAIEALLPLLKDHRWRIVSGAVTDFVKISKEKSDLVFIKKVVDAMMSVLQQQEEGGYYKNKTLEEITEIVNLIGEPQFAQEVIEKFVPFFADSQVRNKIKEGIRKIIQVHGRSVETIKALIPLLKDEKSDVRIIVSSTLVEIANGETQSIIRSLIPLLKDPESAVRVEALKNITELMKLNTDFELSKDVIENFVPFLQDSDKTLRVSASSNIIKILMASSNDDRLVKDTVNLISPVLQHSNSDIAKNAVEILKSLLPKLLLIQPESFAKHLTHSSKDVRETVLSYLLPCLRKYVDGFQKFDLLNHYPTSDLTVEIIIEKLFESSSPSENLVTQIKTALGNPEQLKSLLLSEINKIEAMKGPQIIELAIVIIGQEKVQSEDSDRKKLIELAKEVLPIQLRYLNEEGLVWINKNCERLLSLSPETKLFYKKIYHRLLEDGEITSTEEELLIKFINQGLTTSLTRNGEIIFEGKRYKLKGENIELVLEKIAKTIIEQQQDILAVQYKEHEPIFKISSGIKGGMTQAAADIKEIRSLVDSRHALRTEFWLITRLKSLKFNSEILLLEQRSAFGDHVVYHFNQQRLFRFYPNETPMLQEIFGSYIYGEAYQGEVTELADKAGEKLLESKGITKSTKIQIEGKLKSKQVYFQQELLKEGNEDRNSAVEEELAKKLDNNRAVLEGKLKALKLQDSEKALIEDYYEGFISTFSSVYTSSLAVDSGKLPIDDGEDFFSPVNIFIQLTSLAPFGIGEVLSGGLEAARSYIKGNEIKNEARFVKDIAIDAVELSDLVAKIAIDIVLKKEKRQEILEAKDDEEANNLINKVKNLVMEKIGKLKNMAEKYTKMKNLFEKEVETSPVFRLGESDANKIIKNWIDMKGSQPDLRMKLEEKQKKFVGIILGEEGSQKNGTKKITPLPTSPKEIKPAAQVVEGKSACCEIF